MTRPQYDEFGEYYPAYGFHNDEEYKKTQPKDAICILYSLKASGPLKSKIHGNCYSRISSGMVRFLIREQEAKSALLATKQGQEMSIEKRIQRLMPHEMTTKLFEEMAKILALYLERDKENLFSKRGNSKTHRTFLRL